MLRRCATVANVRANECKCPLSKPTHTHTHWPARWRIEGCSGKTDSDSGTDPHPGRPRRCLPTLSPVIPSGMEASSQVTNGLVLSFLITQRTHQSAHHLSFGKMGTTLSALISSEQEEEKISDDGKPN